MLGVVIASNLLTASYKFTPDVKLSYSVNVDFNGYIPILGGQKGKVEVRMMVGVEGLTPELPNQRAASEIKAFQVVFNGAALPLGVDNVKDYFPRTTISLSAAGKVVKSDAPNIQLPIRLPGLDIKRFPDITYLPIEFPEADLVVGKSWTFKKAFGDSDVEYTCTPTRVDESEVQLDIIIFQQYEILEDEAKNVVKTPKDAVSRVQTTLKGQGKAVFDPKLGAIQSVSMQAAAVSKVTDLETKVVRDRRLETKLDVTLIRPKKQSHNQVLAQRPLNWLESLRERGSSASRQATGIADAWSSKLRGWSLMTQLAWAKLVKQLRASGGR